MRVYRLVPRPYLGQALSGAGAALAPGRWNPPGLAVVYCATTRALAALEMLVHFDPQYSPVELALLTIELPDDLDHASLATRDLPAEWTDTPAPESTRRLGGKHLAGNKIAALFVPSVVIPEEQLCILNPRHRRVSGLKPASVRKFSFDARLTRR